MSLSIDSRCLDVSTTLDHLYATSSYTVNNTVTFLAKVKSSARPGTATVVENTWNDAWQTSNSWLRRQIVHWRYVATMAWGDLLTPCRAVVSVMGFTTRLSHGPLKDSYRVKPRTTNAAIVRTAERSTQLSILTGWCIDCPHCNRETIKCFAPTFSCNFKMMTCCEILKPCLFLCCYYCNYSFTSLMHTCVHYAYHHIITRMTL